MSNTDLHNQLQVSVTDEVDTSKKPYHYSYTYEKASMYQYKFERAPAPDPVDPCFRCNHRVNPGDGVDVGAIYHMKCFRCRLCGIPLSSQTYFRKDANSSDDREVYCRHHVNLSTSDVQPGDVMPEPNHFSPSNKYVIQIDGRIKQPLDASENRLSPRSTSSGSINAPHYSSISQQKANIPSQQRSNTPTQQRSNTPTQQRSNTPTQQRSYTPTYQQLSNSSLERVVNFSQMKDPSPSYGSLYRTGRSQTKFKLPLTSFKDFENSEVFDAQNVLEQRHREEGDRLQRFISEERERELQKVDLMMDREKEQAAEDLLRHFQQFNIQTNPKQMLQEKERLEEHFHRERDERMRIVMENIATEEKTRHSKLLEKHTQEMMMLLAEKDREVDPSALYDHSVRPPIKHFEVKKSELYQTPTIFEKIDKRALELSIRDYMSCTDLVRDLTCECDTELQKARVIFRWIIAKDLNKHNIGEIVRQPSSSSLLKAVKSGKETYHQLFKRLCSYAGLHCEIILGYSKGAGYKPGMKVEGNSFRNSWTAVAIDGCWRFVNCTWAARHVTGHRVTLPDMFYKYDEFYFLTDPEDYIYQHYPDDPEWQLLEIPLPFSEFVNLPVVKSPFFNYGLKFYSNYGATLSTENGITEIRLITPGILGFGSLLEPKTESGDKKGIEGRTLLRLVKQEAIFTVSLPKPGVYYFTIYTGDYWKSECLESACSFLIDCKYMPGLTAPPPYPPVPYFGPTPLLESLAIQPTSQSDPLVVMNGENVEITFSVGKDTKIMHTFQYFDVNDGSITDFDRYVFLKSRNDSTALYLVRCSREGYFIFSLFAADAKSDSLDCVYRYLIVCQQPNSNCCVFPKTFHRWHKCTLHEPLSGDLLCEKRYTFRMDIPLASEVFVALGETWHHLKHKIGQTWEGNVKTGSSSSTVKIYARFRGPVDSSIFAHMLDYEVVEDGETEI